MMGTMRRFLVLCVGDESDKKQDNNVEMKYLNGQCLTFIFFNFQFQLQLMNSSQTKSTPVFNKVKDLERLRSGYNVYVKVVEVTPKQIKTRNGDTISMVDCIVADETGAAKAFFKGDNAKLISEGKVIAIRNGVKRIIKGHISLQVDIFGRITEETKNIDTKTQNNISDQEIVFQRKTNRGPRERNQGYNNRNKPRNNQSRRNPRNDGKRFPNEQNDFGKRNNRSFNKDRDYDRNRPNNRQRQPQKQKRFEERKQQKEQRQFRGKKSPFTKINEIDPGQDELRIISKVLSVTMISGRTTKLRCVLGDETGVVNAFLPESDKLSVGKTVILERAEARVVKEHIEIQLPRFGNVIEARNKMEKVSEKFNLSEKSWVPLN